MDFPWSRRPADVLKALGVRDAKKGLEPDEARKRLAEYGRNELPEDPPTPLWQLVLEQFQDQLVLILLGAAVVSFVLAFFEEDSGEGLAGSAFVEPFVILLILIANATVGVINESRAEQAIEALKEYTPDEAKCVRAGVVQHVNAAELVPGDVILLSAGDKIPADARIVSIQSASFRADQSILTGESVSVLKSADEVVPDEKAVRQDQINMLFSGTTVTVGKCTAVVTATGTETAIGDIHTSISSQISEPTPLKKRLDEFGDQLAKIISVVCVLVWLINIRHFSDQEHFGGNWLKGAIYYFKIAVALAVAAIPEGLAVVITTCLALGTSRMAAQGAIVRKLRSVETLGCTSVICSDKTGTITTNQMSVRRVLTVDASSGSLSELHVTGSSYAPEGAVSKPDGTPLPANALASDPVLDELAQICALCNDSRVVYHVEHGTYAAVGEPTEAALRVLVEKLGTSDAAFNKTLRPIEELPAEAKQGRMMAVNEFVESKYNRVMTLEFSRDRKSMSVLVERADGTPLAESPATPSRRKTRSATAEAAAAGRVMYVKGAPEAVLERCSYIRDPSHPDRVTPLTPHLRSRIAGKLLEWADQDALRVLAFACVDRPSLKEGLQIEPQQYINYEKDMTFVGLVGMLDPPRPEVIASVRRCHDAGVRVIVITGDNKNTAEAICKQIGVFPMDANLEGHSYTGREFDDMTEEQQKSAIRRANLFSRTEPAHKQKLVDLLQQEGWVVAMTGDGVNDAPALKKADIGVAMGTGTDVAKLAGDMVLANDNFATIVSAVEEGRSIYNNTKQFIRYLISSNIGEVVSIFLTVILGMPEALIPVQLLWVNLVTDGLPATALGFNPPDHAIMKLPPRDPNEPIVTRWLFVRYMIIGTYVGCATVFGYAWWFMFYTGGPQISFHQLTNFHKCSTMFPELDCSMFSNQMSAAATTVSLSILVTIEMFNAMNSLSENESLLTLPVWNNLWLCLAIILSMALHFMILYVPFFNTVFSIVGLSLEEWKWVVIISAPVLVLDEILKWVSRTYIKPRAVDGEHAQYDKKKDI